MIDKTEEKIIHKWGGIQRPLVSICSITYNHERFISQALDSFLMQITDFPFEVIVRDDCSTDQTAAIIKQYHERFPNIIKPIFETENQYAKGQRPMPIAVQQATGKYIAMCEGDDYWTDPLKLQKQVDFLDANPSYAIGYHDVKIIDDNDTVIAGCYVSRIKDFSVDEMLSGDATIITSTVMFRNFGTRLFPKIFNRVSNGDMTLWHMLAHYGPGKFQKDITSSAYRIHSGGIWSSIGDEMRIRKTIYTLDALRKNLPLDKAYLESRISKKIQNYHATILDILLKKFNFKGYFRYLYKLYSENKNDANCAVKRHLVQVANFFLKKSPFKKKTQG